VCGCVGVWVCGCVGVQYESSEVLHKTPIELSYWERIQILHRKRLVDCVGVWVCGCVGVQYQSAEVLRKAPIELS